MNFHKEDGNSVVRVRAQVMMRDDSTGGWVPMGGGGLSNVSVRKRKIQHEDDQPCKHEYLIHGKRISDQSVVLSCTIKKDFEYNKVMPTFHHWKTGNKKFGLTFQTAADARAFDKGVRMAIEDLLDGLSETSPLHQYNLDVGDDDVFMQLHLPVEKSESKSPPPPTVCSVNGRSPSPHCTCEKDISNCSNHCHHHYSHLEQQFIQTKCEIFKGPPRPPPPLPASEKLELLSGGGGGGIGGINNGKDKDYSYVKFPSRREPPHEYSYPKLVDAYVGNSGSITLPPPLLPPPLPGSGNSQQQTPLLSLNAAAVAATASTATRRDSITSLKKQVAAADDTFLLKKSPPPSSALGISSSSCSSSNSSNKSVISSSAMKKKKKLLASGGDSNVIMGDMLGGEIIRSPENHHRISTCTHCRESFSHDLNPRGSCGEAPDCLRKSIETCTCLQCAKCLLYHCMSDSEGDYVHPCQCSNVDGHSARRWISLALLSILVPCLCCYLPLISCYKCGTKCNACGGRHQPS